MILACDLNHYADNDPLNKVDPLGLRACDKNLNSLRGWGHTQKDDTGELQGLISFLDGNANSCLMSVDFDGDGRAVVSIGDPSSAPNVLILPSGAGQDLAHFELLLERDPRGPTLEPELPPRSSTSVPRRDLAGIDRQWFSNLQVRGHCFPSIEVYSHGNGTPVFQRLNDAPMSATWIPFATRHCDEHDGTLGAGVQAGS